MELKDTIELMQSSDYKDRFRAEYLQVVIRVRKLQAMLDKWEDGSLNFKPTCPKAVLYAQLSNMQCYRDVLRRRADLEGIDLSEMEE